MPCIGFTVSICKVGATKVEASFNIPKGICVNHYISIYEYHSCSRVRKTMPELPQQILLLREGGMFQHLPAQIMKMWWFSSTLRMPDHYEQDPPNSKGILCQSFIYPYMCTTHVPV